MPESLREVYKLDIRLNDIEPPIFRKVLVSNDVDLSTLHHILQITMGWNDTHLHQYLIDDKRYGTPDPDFDDGTMEESSIKLRTAVKRPGDKMIYEYDFGDGWEHTITLEEILPYTHDIKLPQCISGERSCPPEDVGGAYAYQEFLEGYLNSSHPDHSNLIQWAGEYFEPEFFDIVEVNGLYKQLEAAQNN